MEIIKKLNLNKTPKAVPNNSLICAKNIIISKDGSYITSEDGLTPIYTVSPSTNRIVGVIPCNTELVIFEQDSNRNGHIKRYNEVTNEVTEVPCNWSWDEGIIKGTYTYNVNNELIIAFCEHNTFNNRTSALKTINLNRSKVDDSETSYYVTPKVPICKTELKNFIQGSLIKCGTYNLFIRYKFSNNNYTKWFSIGVPYFITNIDNKPIITHYYPHSNNTYETMVYDLVNSDDQTNFNPVLKFNFSGDTTGYVGYQIGYILDTDNSTVCRLWKEFNFNTTEINFNTSNAVEYPIDDMLESTYSISNVETICNYGNRLYISNYNEHQGGNENISALADAVRVKYTLTNYTHDRNFSNQTCNHFTKDLFNAHRRGLIPNQVYNFFIHYVKDDGSFTEGFQLQNTASDSFQFRTQVDGIPLIIMVNGDTLLANVDDRISINSNLSHNRVCDVYNNFSASDREFGYFTNSEGIKMFKAPYINNSPNALIGVEAVNVQIPAGYVGAFLSYEEVEDNVLFTGYNGSKSCDSGTRPLYLYASDVFLHKRNYKGVTYNVNYTLTSETSSTPGSEDLKFIINMGIEAANDSLAQHMWLSPIPNSGEVITLYSYNKYVYCGDNKRLIRLTDVERGIEGTTITIKDRTDVATFNYPGFIVSDIALLYDPNVFINGETYPAYKSNNELIKSSYAVGTRYLKYCKYYITAKKFKKAPESVAYVSKGTVDRTLTADIVYPINEGDLYQLNPNDYNNQINKKALIEYDKNGLNITRFDKTIRRSDVISDESVDNSWRQFKPINYKVISENKGNITNIVGIGYYLLIHTEHSLFMFSADSTLTAGDKEIQLGAIDVFDLNYKEVITSDKGYAGLKRKSAAIVNQHGYTFMNEDSKIIYSFDNGQLNIISADIEALLKNIDIKDVVFADDVVDRDRLIICIKLVDNTYITLSYNFNQKAWSSLHDYKFSAGYKTKNNLYLTNNDIKLYSFDKVHSCNFRELQIKQDNKFPLYLSDSGELNYSYVDVIFNDAFDIIKSLEFISYLLSEKLDYFSNINNAEGNLNRKFSGYQAIIYSDETYSGLLDINVNNNPNSYNSYKYPYYDRGKWNFNYFRNYVEREDSDDRSLIYGKYIVCRFIFNNDNNVKFKLEGVEFKVNKY